jgi:hypothetical protein
LTRRHFRSCGVRALAAAVVSLASTVAWPSDAALFLDVYGLSYHTDRSGVHAAHLDNELNPGLGVKYELADGSRGVGFAQAGFYKDSGRRWTAMAGPGYQLRVGERWRAGGVLLLFDSQTYNHGRPFIAPIPMLSYDLGAVQLNAAYAPRVSDVNEFAVFGFYVSIPLR